jgi:uncharacterized protein
MVSTPTGWVILLLFGTFTGVLSGLLGIGGGLIIVPFLTMLGVPLVEATATSLVGVLLSSVSASVQNLRTGDLAWRSSLVLAAFGALTAQVGAWLGDRFPDRWLSLAFAGLLLLTIYLMNLRQQLKQRQVSSSTSDQDVHSEDGLSDHSVGNPDVIDSNLILLPTALIGLVTGLLSGLFGVGGGLVMVPLQMLFLNEPIKSAVRTSLGAIVAIAISGLAQHTYNGNVLWVPGLCLGVGGMVGAQLGSRLLPKFSDRTVSLLFRSCLMMLAAYMAVRGIFAR